jgi:DNA-binding transcriptional regulator YiaG
MKPSDLRRLRRRLKLSQAGFAALVGVASNTVARWERGELGMKGTTARLIQMLADGAIKRQLTEKRAR